MSKHTPEPWPPFIDVCEPETPHPDSNEIVCLGFDDYRRARACVNACRGIGTDELEQHGLVSAVGYELIELTKQRDELLRDMQDVLDMLINQPHAVTAANQAEDMLRLSIGTAKYFAKAGSENHSPDIAKMVVPEGLPLVTDSCSALMTLEEAIAHADEKAIGNSQCAAQHAQLAKWLTDYRAMLTAAPKHEGGAS